MKLNRDSKVLSEINVTPFVDVMLVLLIIFMVTAPLLQQGLDVNLPKARGRDLPPEERITLVIKKGGTIEMSEPSLQKTTTLSFAIHLTAFFLTFLVLKQPGNMIIPPPYTVSLVSPDVLTGINKGKSLDDSDTSKESTALPDIPEKNIKEISKRKELAEEKISAIVP